MRLDKVSENVYSNCEGKIGSNVGVIVLDDRVAAMDAQFPASGRDFRASIPLVTDKPVTHLLLTHMHSDHVLGSPAFEDCEIVGHVRVKEKIEERLRTDWAPRNLEKMLEDIKVNQPEMARLYEGMRIVLPTETFIDSYTLDGVEAINTGGHTDCSSIVYVPEDKTLFTGDLIIPKSFLWAGDPTANPEAWIGGFRKMLERDVDIIIPGHGQPCNKEEVKTQLTYFEATRRVMVKLIAEGASEEEAVNYDGYPDFYELTGDEKPHYMRAWYRTLSNES